MFGKRNCLVLSAAVAAVALSRVWLSPTAAVAQQVAIPLRPATGSEVLFDSITTVQDLDGGFSTRARYRANSGRRDVIFFRIDAKAKTYHGMKFGPNEASNTARLRALLRRAGVDLASLKDGAAELSRELTLEATKEPIPQPAAPPVCAQCDDVCSGAGFVQAKVHGGGGPSDKLARTTYTGGWMRTGAGGGECEWIMNGHVACWAANPSSLGTHWFVDQCFGTGPWGSDGDYFFRGQGDYSNSDFGLPNLWTFATAGMEVNLFDGVTWVDTFFDRSGELASFLGSSVIIDITNDCTH